ncbi:MAG: hypothetical protein WAW42_01945 [Candidatus Competibacteraceae bacterium]|jgi:hypothetical protein
MIRLIENAREGRDGRQTQGRQTQAQDGPVLVIAPTSVCLNGLDEICRLFIGHFAVR